MISLVRIPGPGHLTLHFYIGRRFAGLVAANLVLFSLIYTLIDSLSQFDSFMKASDGVTSFLRVAFVYYYYQFPGLICQFLGPLVAMASAMFAVTITQRANEFVPILASGTSLQRAILPVPALTVLLSGGSLALQEVWIPAHRREIREARAYGRGYGEIKNAHFADRQKGLIVAARLYRPLTQQAEGVWILVKENAKEYLYTAATAYWEQGDGLEGAWILGDGEIQEYGEDGRLILQTVHEECPDGSSRVSRRLSRHFDTFRFDRRTTMIPQDLEGNESQDMFLGLAELRRKVEVSPDRHRWRIRYYSRFVDPLNYLILVLLGVPTVLSARLRNIFLSVLVAAMVATGYFSLQTAFVDLGNRNFLSPAIAVWLMPILFGSMGLTMLRGVRT